LACTTEAFYDSVGASSSGKPNIRRFRSIDPTAMYLESAPNFTHVALPGKSSSVVLVTEETQKPSNPEGIINNGGKIQNLFRINQGRF